MTPRARRLRRKALHLLGSVALFLALIAILLFWRLAALITKLDG